MKTVMCSAVAVVGVFFVTGCSSSVPSGVGPQNTKVGAVIHRDSKEPLTNDEVMYQQDEILKIQKRHAERQQRELEDLRRQDYQNQRLREYEAGH